MTAQHHEMKTVCPHCGYRHDAAAAVDDDERGPEDGNLSLCFECGEWSVFEDGNLRKPTDAEYLDFGTLPSIQKIRRAWVDMDRRRRRERAG